MEETVPGNGNDDAAPATLRKTEEADIEPSAPAESSQESPAPRGVSVGTTGGGGGQTAEEHHTSSSSGSTPVLLYPVNTERLFTTTADGKTYLKIAPASGMAAAASSEKPLAGSDFSSKAVLCLIEAVGRRWGLYETRERSQLFQSVQEEMASKGHVLPVEKIRRKWNNLIVTYKRVKDRSMETGHAKTSWEFFEMMDATLCDTVGTQIINNKRNKPSNSASCLPGPLAKIVVKPQIPQATTIVQPSSATILRSAESRAQTGSQMTSGTSAVSSMTTVTISPTSTPEIKPLIVLNGDIVTSSLHPSTTVPSSSFISSPTATSTAKIDLKTARFITRKAPIFSSNVIPLRLSNAQFSRNIPGLSSSTSCLTAPISTSLPASSGIETQPQKVSEEQTTTALFREILKRQEEHAYLDRVCRRRMEAREKRRERREVRMAESMGRVATALELLSSKQDTVIALLQRLAERK